LPGLQAKIEGDRANQRKKSEDSLLEKALKGASDAAKWVQGDVTGYGATSIGNIGAPNQAANEFLPKVLGTAPPNPQGAVFQEEVLGDKGTVKRTSVVPITPLDLIGIGAEGAALKGGGFLLRAGGKFLTKGGERIVVSAEKASELVKAGKARFVKKPPAAPAQLPPGRGPIEAKPGVSQAIRKPKPPKVRPMPAAKEAPAPKAPKPAPVEQASAPTKTRTVYHVAPRSRRASILEHGIDAMRSPDRMSTLDKPMQEMYQIKLNGTEDQFFAFNNRAAAVDYAQVAGSPAPSRRNIDPFDAMDVWRVEVPQEAKVAKDTSNVFPGRAVKTSKNSVIVQGKAPRAELLMEVNDMTSGKAMLGSGKKSDALRRAEGQKAQPLGETNAHGNYENPTLSPSQRELASYLNRGERTQLEEAKRAQAYMFRDAKKADAAGNVKKAQELEQKAIKANDQIRFWLNTGKQRKLANASKTAIGPSAPKAKATPPKSRVTASSGEITIQEEITAKRALLKQQKARITKLEKQVKGGESGVAMELGNYQIASVQTERRITELEKLAARWGEDAPLSKAGVKRPARVEAKQTTPAPKAKSQDELRAELKARFEKMFATNDPKVNEQIDPMMRDFYAAGGKLDEKFHAELADIIAKRPKAKAVETPPSEPAPGEPVMRYRENPKASTTKAKAPPKAEEPVAKPAAPDKEYFTRKELAYSKRYESQLKKAQASGDAKAVARVEAKIAKLEAKVSERTTRQAKVFVDDAAKIEAHAESTMKNPAPPSQSMRDRALLKVDEARGRANEFATAAPEPVKKAGRGAAIASKPVRWFIRHPFKGGFGAIIALQVPQAVDEKSLSPFLEGLQTGGSFRALSGQVGTFAASLFPGKGVADNFIKDLIDFPASAIPSIYMVGSAVWQKANGNSDELNRLWQSYLETGFIPAVERWATGDGGFNDVVKTFAEHPLYSALEVSGGYAVAGRGVGMLSRGARSASVSETLNKPLADTKLSGLEGAQGRARVIFGKAGKPGDTRRDPKIDPFGRPIKQSYSNNAMTKQAQIAWEKWQKGRGNDPFKLSPYQAKRALQLRADAAAAQGEGVRRFQQEEIAKVLEVSNSIKSETGGKFKISKPLRPIVGLIFDNTVRSPETYLADLRNALGVLNDSRPILRGKAKRAENEIMLDSIKTAIAKAERANEKDLAEIGRLFEAKDVYRAAEQELMKKLVKEGLYTKEMVDYARVVPYAVYHMGARWDEGLQELVQSATGKVLDTEAITNNMKSQGVGTPGFITQAPGWRSAGSFYQPIDLRSGRHGFINRRSRTGNASAQGTWDASLGAAEEYLKRSQSILSRIEGVDRAVREEAVRVVREDGSLGPAYRFKSFSEYQDALRNPEEFEQRTGVKLHIAEGVEYAPVRSTPTFSSAEEVAAAAKSQKLAGDKEPQTFDAEIDQSLGISPQRIAENVDKVISDRLMSPPGEGPFIAVPKAYRDRMAEHVKPSNDIQRLLQVQSTLFKGAVLPLSVSWYAGNFVDVAMRTLAGGITGIGTNTAGSILAKTSEKGTKLPDTARRFLAGSGKILLDMGDVGVMNRVYRAVEREHGPEEAQRLAQLVEGGRLFGSTRNTAIYRGDPEQWNSEWIKATARGLERVWATPKANRARVAWNVYRNNVFRLNSQLLEGVPMRGAAGKAVRKEIQEITGRYSSGVRVMEQAINDYAKGLKDTRAQAALAKNVSDLYGQWNVLSPNAKQVLVYYAPFGLWWRAATKFVYYTLPVKHPIKTAILGGMEQMTLEDRKRLGLSSYAAKEVPTYLRGGIPTKDGLWMTNKYTSFGTAIDPFGNLQGMIGGPARSSALALAGEDWKFAPLQTRNGEPLGDFERAAYALFLYLEATTPGMRQIVEAALGSRPFGIGGPTSRKPTKGFTSQALLDSLLPTGKLDWKSVNTSRDFYNPNSRSGSSKSSGGGDWWGGSSGSNSTKKGWWD
jgi:hypothetical protein